MALTSRCVQAMTCRSADPKEWVLPEEVARTVWNRINPPPGVESLPHGPNIALGQPATQSSTALNTLTFQQHLKHLALSAAERATDGYCEDSPYSISETKREVQVITSRSLMLCFGVSPLMESLCVAVLSCLKSLGWRWTCVRHRLPAAQ